jgi:hypothetical protein
MFKNDMTITGTIFTICLVLIWLETISILFAIFIMISWLSVTLVHFKDFYASSIGRL